MKLTGMSLAERVRKALSGKHAITEKKMFGGTCFLLRSRMLCGTVGARRAAGGDGRPGVRGVRLGRSRELRRPGPEAMDRTRRRLRRCVAAEEEIAMKIGDGVLTPATRSFRS